MGFLIFYMPKNADLLSNSGPKPVSVSAPRPAAVISVWWPHNGWPSFPHVVST